MRTFFPLILGALFAGPAWADGIPPPTIEVQNKVVHNACTPKGLRLMKSQLRELRLESPEEAWTAVETILCGAANQRNLRYLSKLVLPEVEVRHELEEGEEPSLMKGALVQPHHVFAQKFAYRVGLSKNGNILKIQYEPSEVCVARRTLKYIENKWRLAEVMYGCE